MFDLTSGPMSDVNIIDSSYEKVACQRDSAFRVFVIRSYSVCTIVIGFVMITLQIAALTVNNDPLVYSYDYIGHGIWAGLLSELASVICLFAVSRKTASLMISGTIMSFYSSSACLVSTILSRLSFENTSCHNDSLMAYNNDHCNFWKNTEGALIIFSSVSFFFCAACTVAMVAIFNSEGVCSRRLGRLVFITSFSIVLCGVVSSELQITLLFMEGHTFSRGSIGQGMLWASGDVFYLATGIIGLLPNRLNRINSVLAIGCSTISVVFSVYFITEQTGIDGGVRYPSNTGDFWKRIFWVSMMAFSVVAFIQTAFMVLLSSISVAIDHRFKVSVRELEKTAYFELPKIRTVFV